MGIRKLAAVGIAAALVATTATAASAAPDQRVDPAVLQAGLDRMARDGAQGVQLRVVDGDRTLLLRSGTARAGSPRPVPLNGRFRVGSVTKTFVATVVLQLVAEGRVSLDAPVSNHLPGLVDDRITVRMLLQHTSGLYDYTRALPLDGETFLKERFTRHDPRDLVAMSTSRPLDFTPGERHEYSNTNYIVAGLLIKQVTGKSWERSVNDRILRPLGLHATATGGLVPQGPHARGYLQINGKLVDVTALNSSMAWAAGSMISTTADLDRFYAALLDGDLLPPAQLAEMKKTVDGYGLGIYEFPMPCGITAWGHGGGIPGYITLSINADDTRLEMSMTTGALDEDGVDGLDDTLIAAFCP
ncbi:serine hydrolase domain-containing protein [Actinokineospora soli]|uniref:Serine hydrolase domain-containing protein n=1 Tax=Actinokineospora soli TaxID=1048753 RepID=A0ABW2TI50_9PSEU